MNPPVRFGLILGIVVALLGYVVPIAGLHTNPVMPTVFVAAAVVVNVVCVFLALRQTAHDSAWMGQVVNALIVGAIGAVLIFAGSWTMTTWVFPEYYAEYAAAAREAMATTGLPDDLVAAQMAAIEETTPTGSAFSGAIGAIITSAVAGAVVGAFKRQGR